MWQSSGNNSQVHTFHHNRHLDTLYWPRLHHVTNSHRVNVTMLANLQLNGLTNEKNGAVSMTTAGSSFTNGVNLNVENYLWIYK